MANYNTCKTSTHNKLLKWYHPNNCGDIVSNNDINVIEFPGTEVKKISIDMCTQPKLAPEKMLKTYDNKPQILTNLSFFATSTGDSIFNVISNGKVYSSDNQYTGGMGIKKDGSLQAGEVYEGNWDDFASSYPTLIKDGQVLPNDWMWGQEINYKAHRTIWGWTKGKATIFNICIEGKGATFQNEQKIITTLFPDVEYAFNYDGGGSVAQYFDNTRISDAGWERPVDTVLSVWLRSDADREENNKEEKVLYRVQLGAFSKKGNCEKYLKEIQSLKTDIHDYSDAYMKYIEPYWKVQCGSFSKKENAEKLSNDLKQLGYDNYITTK